MLRRRKVRRQLHDELDKEPIMEYFHSNITMLRWMIDNGYPRPRTLERRAQAMEKWLANPVLLEPDSEAEYFKVIEIDLNEIKEPLLACPNDPDDIKTLSEVADTKIDGVSLRIMGYWPLPSCSRS